MDQNLKQRLYRIFDPEPLTPQQDDLYVSLDEVRGSTGVVRKLAERICLSDGPTAQILAGHRGSGKSTELHLLQGILRSDGNAGFPGMFFPVYVEGKEDLDLADVDFPEVLIALVRQMAAQLKADLGITLAPGYFKHLWERLTKLLGEVSFEGAELHTGLLNLSTTIKGSPDARLKIREALEPDTGNLVNAANDVIGQAKLELKEKGFQDLVIIFDDLDKITNTIRKEAACTQSEYLFINRQAQLTGFDCHVVYTIPIETLFSHREQTIANLYGGHPPIVPMTRIAGRPPERKRYTKGLKAFEELIAKRLARAEASEDKVFASTKVRNEIIRTSGGQPRELMLLLREALVGGELPITLDAVRRAAQEGRRAYTRELREEHWPIIEEVRAGGAPSRTQANEQPLRELLDMRAILQYRNEDEWYDQNPLIADLKPPAPRDND